MRRTAPDSPRTLVRGFEAVTLRLRPGVRAAEARPRGVRRAVRPGGDRGLELSAPGRCDGADVGEAGEAHVRRGLRLQAHDVAPRHRRRGDRPVPSNGLSRSCPACVRPLRRRRARVTEHTAGRERPAGTSHGRRSTANSTARSPPAGGRRHTVRRPVRPEPLGDVSDTPSEPERPQPVQEGRPPRWLVHRGGPDRLRRAGAHRHGARMGGGPGARRRTSVTGSGPDRCSFQPGCRVRKSRTPRPI